MQTMLRNNVKRTAKKDDFEQQAESFRQEQSDNRTAGWLCPYLAPDRVRDSTLRLQKEIKTISDDMSHEELTSLRTVQKNCCAELVKVIQAGALRWCDEGKKNRCLRTVGKSYTEFCEIAIHYQNVFDVLSNVGDYTPVVWGAIKMLLTYRVNDQRLREEVWKRLYNIGELLTQLSPLTGFSKHWQLERAVTKTYDLLQKFLTEALHYFKERKISRMLKNITQPWELRFQPVVGEIQESLQQVHLALSVSVASIVGDLNRNFSKTIKESLEGYRPVVEIDPNQMLLLTGGKELRDQLQESQAINHELLMLERSRSGYIRGERKLWSKQLGWEVTKERKLHSLDDDSLLISDVSNIQDFLEKSFPMLTEVSKAKQTREKKYRPDFIRAHCKDSPSVSNFEWSLTKHPNASEWTSGTSSHMLWIEGYQEGTPLHWTTRISLDFQRLAKTIPDSCILSFYTEDMEKIINPSLILQTFIHQILVQSWKSFTAIKCFQRVLSIKRIEACGEDFSKLWSFFSDCLDIAELKGLFVIIDNMDILLNKFTPMQVDGILELLNGLAKAEGTMCKVLTTIRINNLSPKPLSSLADIRRQIPKENLSYLYVPRSRQCGVDGRKQRRKYRLSIVGNMADEIDDPIIKEIMDEQEDEIVHSESGSDSDVDIEAIIYGNKSTSPLPREETGTRVHSENNDISSIDTDLSDYYSDNHVSISRSPELFPKKDYADDEDDVLRELIGDSESDIDLDDLDIQLQPAGAKTSSRDRHSSEIVDSDSDDDIDIDNL